MRNYIIYDELDLMDTYYNQAVESLSEFYPDDEIDKYIYDEINYILEIEYSFLTETLYYSKLPKKSILLTIDQYNNKYEIYYYDELVENLENLLSESFINFNSLTGIKLKYENDELILESHNGNSLFTDELAIKYLEYDANLNDIIDIKKMDKNLDIYIPDIYNYFGEPIEYNSIEELLFDIEDVENVIYIIEQALNSNVITIDELSKYLKNPIIG